MPAALSTGQQVILGELLLFGKPIPISISTLAFRMYVFESRFKDIVEAEREWETRPIGAVVGMAGAIFGHPVVSTCRSKDKFQSRSRMSTATSKGNPRAAYYGWTRNRAGFSRDDIQYEVTRPV
ncbi:hypothetical protein VPNG_08785 [Cytospora leucostoma]|uniref:Uncharacterized protein n=1 Tax=Cytospora leucostoma TaxID=1230097 RepID=A0A423W1F7_9PEZI|nr:hypothetical protein VPNG_08785 [Cytospora leucostoma]